MICLTLILTLFQAPPLDGPPPPPLVNARQPGPHPVTHRIGVPVPEPICPTDLQRYGEFLTLAAPQQLLLTEAHKRYVERLRQIINEGEPALDALNATASAASEQHPQTFLAARTSRELYDQQGRIRREIEHADGVLFAELESVLAESQKPAMQRVRNDRLRAASTTRVTWMVRAAQIDLAAITRILINDAEALLGVDQILREYELAVTPLVAALEREMTDVRIPILELSAWRVRNEDDQAVPQENLRERSMLASEKRMQLLAESVRLQRRIAEMNASALAALLESLPPDRAETLQREYRLRAFGVVYDDQFRAHRVCETVLDSTSINEAQRAAIESLCSGYVASYDAINAEMERLYSDRCLQFAATLGNKHYEPYRLKMRQLREDRWQLSLNLVRHLQGLAPGIETAADLQYLRQAIEQAFKDSVHDQFPGA